MILIKNGRVVDAKSNTDEVLDVVIDGGKIKTIGKVEDDGSYEQVIDADGCVVAPGLIDVHVHFRDPGLTYKEDIQTGSAAAKKGGYTTVVTMANTKPPVDNVETVKYIIEEGKKTGINVLPAACVSVGMKGQELTDMDALKAAGAVGFTDDGIPLMNEKLVYEAMKKAKELNVPLSFHEEDPAFISENGINAGAVAKELGITGSPALAEDSLVARDCMIALHTGASVNIQHISSATSVKAVKLAKELGANVTAEVTPHHFTLDETAVLEHGAMAKMNPPLRTAKDREGIIEGIKDGSIDMIATDHAPHSAQEKARGLAGSAMGIVGLETAFPILYTHLVRTGVLTLEKLVELMAVNPRKRFGFPLCADDYAVWDLNTEYRIDPAQFCSMGKSTPFAGHTPAVMLFLRNDNILTLPAPFFRPMPSVFLSQKTTKNQISHQISWQK